MRLISLKNASSLDKNKSMDPKQSVYNGLLMTAGILSSTFVVKKVKKDLAPQLSTGSAVALGTVTVLSQLAIDYGQEKGWIPPKV